MLHYGTGIVMQTDVGSKPKTQGIVGKSLSWAVNGWKAQPQSGLMHRLIYTIIVWYGSSSIILIYQSSCLKKKWSFPRVPQEEWPTLRKDMVDHIAIQFMCLACGFVSFPAIRSTLHYGAGEFDPNRLRKQTQNTRDCGYIWYWAVHSLKTVSKTTVWIEAHIEAEDGRKVTPAVSTSPCSWERYLTLVSEQKASCKAASVCMHVCQWLNADVYM